MRWLFSLCYLLLVPLSVMGYCGHTPAAKILGIPLLLAGCLVTHLTLRQQRLSGLLLVAAGYLLGMLIAVALGAFAIMALAFLSSSGQHAGEIAWAMAATCSCLALGGPSLGAWLGSRFSRP